MKPTFKVIAGLLGAIASAGAAFAVIKSYNPFALRTDFVIVAGDVYSGEVNDQNKFILDLEDRIREAEASGDYDRAKELKERLLEATESLKYFRLQQDRYR